METSNNCFHII